MPYVKTTDDLLAEARGGVAAPSANGLISPSELLSFADSDMRTELAQILIGTRSEYWLTDYTTPVVASQSTYRLPDRALGMGLRDVTVLDSGGREYNCTQIPADQRYLWSHGQSWGESGPFVFTFENGSVTLLPTPAQSSQWTLRMRYYAEPSTLDLLENCSAFSNTPPSPTQIALDDTVSPATGNNAVIDIIYGAGMHEVMFTERLVNSAVGTTIILQGDTPIVPEDVAGNDVSSLTHYVARLGRTPLPPIPMTLWPALVALTRRSYCEAIGDMRGMEAASAMYERKRAAALSLLQPRVDGEVRRPVPLFTPLRGGRYRGRGWAR
jgi:hypothetical protein